MPIDKRKDTPDRIGKPGRNVARRVARDLLWLTLLASPGAIAQEFAVLGGGVRSSDLDNRSYAWAIDYQQNLGPYFALGVGYVNEGHEDDNHRDGATVQIRARTRLGDSPVTLAVGVGPYYSFNTTRTDSNSKDTVDHDWGVLYSLAANWDLGRAWFLQARVQYIASNQFDTTAVLIGGGYRFGAEGSGAGTPSVDAPALPNELTLFGGRTIANTFESESATAYAVEYRRSFQMPLEWTVTGLHEGDTGPVSRRGIATEIWGVLRFLDDRASIAAGLGPYFLLDVDSNDPSTNADQDNVAGIMSLSIAYRGTPRWTGRFTWHRVFAENSRDTDVLLLGVGYRF